MVFRFLQTQSRGPRRVFPRVKLKGILDVLGNMISYQVYLSWVVAKVFESQLVRGFCEIWNSGKQVITKLAKFWIIASVGFSQKGEQPCCFFRSGLVFLELHIVLTRISNERMGFGWIWMEETIQQGDQQGVDPTGGLIVRSGWFTLGNSIQTSLQKHTHVFY